MLRCWGRSARGAPVIGPGESGRGVWLNGADEGLMGRECGATDELVRILEPLPGDDGGGPLKR